jgi:hypothetical protein
VPSPLLRLHRMPPLGTNLWIHRAAVSLRAPASLAWLIYCLGFLTCTFDEGSETPPTLQWLAVSHVAQSRALCVAVSWHACVTKMIRKCYVDQCRKTLCRSFWGGIFT